MVFALPDVISDEAGALLEPLAVAVWACRRGRVAEGERVLVTGAGPVGLLVAQVAAAWGAEAMVVDVNPARLTVAGSFSGVRPVGAQASVDGVDVLIECSGAAPALAAAVDCVRPAGTVVIVGMAPEGAVTLPLTHLQRRELTVTGSFRYAGCYPEAIALAASGQVALDGLITGRFALAATEAALTAGRTDPAALKSIVIP